MVCDEADCSPYSVPSANIGGVSTYHYPEECSNLVENLADDISLNGLANHQPGGGEDDEKSLESCCNGRFIKVGNKNRHLFFCSTRTSYQQASTERFLGDMTMSQVVKLLGTCTPLKMLSHVR